MNWSKLDYLDQTLLNALRRSYRQKRFNFKPFKKLWKQHKEEGIPFIEFCYMFARALVLDDFYSFCLMIGIPVDRNPHYIEVFKLWKENDKLVEAGDPNGKSITLIMLPRGALKSTIQIAKGNWRYLRNTIVYAKSPVVLVAHGNIDKAQENLTLIRENFDREILRSLFPDVLEYTTKTKKSIRFRDSTTIKRKEDHFIIGSPKSDLTGKHMTVGLIDDWVTDENTATLALNEENKKSFYRLFSLDDHSGGNKVSLILDIVCTEYRDDSLYADLEKNQEVLFLKIPCVDSGQFRIEEGDKEKGFKSEQKFNFPEILDYKKLSIYKKTLPHNQFVSQYDLVPYSRDKGLEFDIELPEFQGVPPLQDRSYVAITADPSISKKNRKSQAVVLVSIIDNKGNVHVVDGIANYGMKPSEHAHWIMSLARKWKADVAIVEAIHYQEALAQEVERLMREERTHRFAIKRHKHFVNKKEHYKMFLEPLLSQGRIFVNPKLQELISQINGESSLDDQVDCLSFLKELKIDHLAMLGGSKIDTGFKMGTIKRKTTNNDNVSFGAFGW
jgi:hypothetical protein